MTRTASCTSSATPRGCALPRSEPSSKSSPAYETGKRGHGDPSRWKNEKDLEWIELRPELVVEVTFDHASGGRIRHGTEILRWRDDKPPTECRLEQMQSELSRRFPPRR